MGLIGTLLTGTAAIWFTPLFDRDEPIMSNLEEFLTEFEETFGDLDRATTAANLTRNHYQESMSAF